MKTNKTILTSVGAALLLSASANAALVDSGTGTYNFGTVGVTPGPNSALVLTLDTFDLNSLGVGEDLIQVNISVTVTVDANGDITYDNPQPGASGTAGFGDLQTTLEIVGPGSINDSDTTTYVNTASQVAISDVDTVVFQDGVYSSFTPHEFNYTFTGVDVNDFTSNGAGSFNLTFDGAATIGGQFASLPQGASLTFEPVGIADIEAVVSYETGFNAIPEPSTFGALAVLGSLGLMVLRRRSR